MPDAPKRPCPRPGCPEYLPCPVHKPSPYRYRGGQAVTTAERGYDAAWRRFAEWFKRRHPLCVGTQIAPPAGDWMDREQRLWLDCGQPATQVHHIFKLVDFPEFRLVERKCLPQCDSCHSVRTARGE